MQKKKDQLLSFIQGEIFGEEAGYSASPISPKLLKRVLNEVITKRQFQFVMEYYFNGLTIYETALKHGVGAPCVSRTLSRARKNIYNSLKYLLEK